MKYIIDDLERDLAQYLIKTAPLRKAKGADYASQQDTFCDLRPLGCDYIVKRMIQKLYRVLNLLTKPPAVNNEKIEQEFIDIFNFAGYLPILYKQINEKKE